MKHEDSSTKFSRSSDPTATPSRVVHTADLEVAIEGIVASYEGPDEINNLDSAALPNKRAVIDAFLHIKSVLYMGFYSVGTLNRDNLRERVSEHVRPAVEVFIEQIERAVRYEEMMGMSEVQRPKGWGEQVILRILTKLPDLRRVLSTDVHAAFAGDPAAASVEEIVFSYPSIQAVTAYRFANLLHHESVPMIPRIITQDAHSRTGIDIHPGATIGESFFIDHGTGVVIGQTAVIGDRVKLYQGVTLGALSVPRDEAGECMKTKRHPTIEDDATIYAGASILGGDTVIGAGSVVGGNVWITQSVSPGSKVFGRAK